MTTYSRYIKCESNGRVTQKVKVMTCLLLLLLWLLLLVSSSSIERETTVLLDDNYSLSLQFFPRDSMLSALYATANPSIHPSICLSVCPTHGWISQKRLKWRSCNLQFSPYSSPIPFCLVSFIQKFWRVPLNGGVKQGWGRKNSQFSANNSPYLRNGGR